MSGTKASRRLSLPAVVCIMASASLARAQDACSVPGSHPTIQAAVDDPACATISLAEQSYPESVQIHRTVEIDAPPGKAELQGRVEVTGSATLAALASMKIISGCQPSSLRVWPGAKVANDQATPLVVNQELGGPCPAVESMIFSDDFESGSTDSWSRTVP